MVPFGRYFQRPVLLLGCIALLSCHSAGLRRSYMALDGSGNRRVSGENAIFFQDDLEINAIAEIVSGRSDVEVSCRWTLTPAPGASIPKLADENVRNLDGPPKTEHNYVFLNYPGRGENILVRCTLRKESNGAVRASELPWPYQGLARVDWYIDSEFQESTGFEVRNEKRFIE